MQSRFVSAAIKIDRSQSRYYSRCCLSLVAPVILDVSVRTFRVVVFVRVPGIRQYVRRRLVLYTFTVFRYLSSLSLTLSLFFRVSMNHDDTKSFTDHPLLSLSSSPSLPLGQLGPITIYIAGRLPRRGGGGMTSSSTPRRSLKRLFAPRRWDAGNNGARSFAARLHYDNQNSPRELLLNTILYTLHLESRP